MNQQSGNEKKNNTEAAKVLGNFDRSNKLLNISIVAYKDSQFLLK